MVATNGAKYSNLKLAGNPVLDDFDKVQTTISQERSDVEACQWYQRIQQWKYYQEYLVSHVCHVTRDCHVTQNIVTSHNNVKYDHFQGLSPQPIMDGGRVLFWIINLWDNT